MQNDYKGTTKALTTLKKKKSKINFQGEDFKEIQPVHPKGDQS